MEIYEPPWILVLLIQVCHNSCQESQLLDSFVHFMLKASQSPKRLHDAYLEILKPQYTRRYCCPSWCTRIRPINLLGERCSMCRYCTRKPWRAHWRSLPRRCTGGPCNCRLKVYKDISESRYRGIKIVITDPTGRSVHL